MYMEHVSKLQSVYMRPDPPNLETLHPIVPYKLIEYGVYGDLLIIVYPKPYSIYLRGTIHPKLKQNGGNGP